MIILKIRYNHIWFSFLKSNKIGENEHTFKIYFQKAVCLSVMTNYISV